jgi:hypothetical protein
MGWLFTHRDRGTSNRDWFLANSLGPKFTIHADATVKGTWYAAVSHENKPDQVFCLVYLTRWMPKDEYNFGYKDMDESVGPYANDCPARILDLLTPTDSEYANAFRKRCRAFAALPKVEVGQTVRTKQMIRFGSREENTFTKVSLPRRKNIFRAGSGQLVRFPNLKNYEFEIVA